MQYSSAQSYHLTSNCANFNAFMDDGSMQQIEPYTYLHYPNGTLMIDPAQMYSISADDLLNEMNLDAGTSFAFNKTFSSQYRTDEYFEKYQQYFNGVVVEGGGYTGTFYRENIGVGGAGLCDPLAIFSPHILTGISVSTIPTILESDAPNILQASNIRYLDLVISYDLNQQCGYALTWKATYLQNGQKTSWVDAHTGTILKTIDSAMGIDAPLTTYSTPQLMDDYTDGTGTTFLQSPNGDIILYDFGGNCPEQTLNESEWDLSLVPSTNNSQWTTEADSEAYQAFFVTSQVLPVFEDLGIDFGIVNVAYCTGLNAFSMFGSTLDNAYFYLGYTNGNTTALYDIAAHELAHSFLNEFFVYATPGTQSLHEGIADILATYIESVVTGNIDWIIGDDEPGVASGIDRDLQNPDFDCFTDVVDFSSDFLYERSQPLSHWFYLASQGSNQGGNLIPAIGMQTVIEILIEALKRGGFDEINADYPDLMAATLIEVEERFGRCSDEFLAIARAWEAICVDTGIGNGIPSCNFSIINTTNDVVCEEDDFLSLYLQGGLPAAQGNYQWTIHGGGSFVTTGNQQGNNIYGGTSLTITDFPEYAYYPQYLVIEVYSPTVGAKYTERKRITLIDCDGDDPTCEEYFGLKRSLESDNLDSESIVETIRGFDFMGRLVFEQSASDFEKRTLVNQGLTILIFYDKNEQVVKTEKSLILR